MNPICPECLLIMKLVDIWTQEDMRMGTQIVFYRYVCNNIEKHHHKENIYLVLKYNAYTITRCVIPVNPIKKGELTK